MGSIISCSSNASNTKSPRKNEREESVLSQTFTEPTVIQVKAKHNATQEIKAKHIPSTQETETNIKAARKHQKRLQEKRSKASGGSGVSFSQRAVDGILQDWFAHLTLSTLENDMVQSVLQKYRTSQASEEPQSVQELIQVLAAGGVDVGTLRLRLIP